MSDFVRWPPVAGPGTRAAGYVMCTGTRAFDEYQERRIEKTAARWGWHVVGIWAEDARYLCGGADRPEFAAMVGDLDRLGVGVVLAGEALFLGWDAVTRFAMVRRIEAASGAVVSEVSWVGGRELGFRGR